MTNFILSIVSQVLWLASLAIIISAVLSWLVAFNVVNVRHPAAATFLRFLDAVTRPILWPFQRVIPPLGGVDITPLLALLVIQAARTYLLPWIGGFLYPLIG